MIRGRQRLDPKPPSPEFLEAMARVYRFESKESADGVYHAKVVDHLRHRADYARAIAIVGRR